jgi:WS/DGAT/MGAT family acyltransferase
VDIAWLRMDRPQNLMMIVGVLVFDERMRFADLKRVITKRMLAYPRFRQRPIQEAGGAYWAEDRDFDLDHHLTRAKLGGARGPAELRALAAELISAPLDSAHPLWQFTFIENYQQGCAIVARFHHCYADGIALIGVMLSLTDEAPVIADKPSPVPPRRKSADRDAANVLGQFFEPMTDAVMSAVKVSGNVFEKYVEMIRNPTQALDYAKVGAAIGVEVAQLATMPDDSHTRYKGKPGVAKRVAWTETLPLEEVKAIGRALGCSVNDVLLSCVAGALGGYLRRRGDATDDVEIRALVPVNLRAPGKEHKLGNRFGLVALVLPLGIVNPVARIHEVHRRMEALKKSYQAALTLGILGLMGLCPKPVQQQILDILASKATAVMTNVPGPQKTLYLAKARLASMMFWVPQSGDIGMGVSILSYNGGVQFGLVTDAGLTPHPEQIIERFGPEFEALVLAMLMEPWDEPRDPAVIQADLERALGAISPLAPKPTRPRARKPKAAAPAPAG